MWGCAVATPEEPTVARIHELARDGLSKLGHHGEMGSMSVPRKDLTHWDDMRILPAQMAALSGVRYAGVKQHFKSLEL